MQSNQTSLQYGKVSSIYPYYKPDNIFQRDQAYYDQLQKNTRRPQNSIGSNSQIGSRVPYQPVQTQYNNLPPNYVPVQNQYVNPQSQYIQSQNQYIPQQQSQYGNPSNQYGYQTNPNQFNSTVQNVPLQSQNQSHYDVHELGYVNQSFGQGSQSQPPTFSRADNSNPNNVVLNPNITQNLGLMMANNPEIGFSAVTQQNHRTQSEQNKRLKQRLDDLINYRDQYDDGSEVKKKHHYNTDTNEGRMIMNQQADIQRLLELIKKNNMDIGRYRNAIAQLQKSTNNIQSVDRQIYRQLKNLSNRDQELLDRATSALARGAARQEIAGILERIIS